MHLRGLMRGVVIIALAIAAAITITPLADFAMRWRRYHAHDDLIEAVARANRLSPRLIWTVIWRESNFDVKSVGKAGEIGLMQVTEAAAREWAAACRVAGFSKRALFDPETNIRAGTWYLARAIAYWSTRDDPLPYALAEYNAGRSCAQRWARAARSGKTPDFLHAVSYPTTRRYIEVILLKYRGYVQE